MTPEGFQWRKSSYSEENGCVEVAWVGPCPDGQCVEVAFGDYADGAVVAVRDSKEGPDGSALYFTAHEWSAFLDGVRAGEFDPGECPECGVLLREMGQCWRCWWKQLPLDTLP